MYECFMSQFSKSFRYVDTSTKKKKINTCLPNNADMPSLFTHCHRNGTVLRLVCVFVALVDGMFERKGSTNCLLNKNTVACRKTLNLSIIMELSLVIL